MSSRAGSPRRGYRGAMFLFFSNRVGCLGSLLLSVVVTFLLLLIFAR
jgi:hypothetical protein